MAKPVNQREKRGEIPYRTLGKTGERVSCIGLGGFHLGQSRLEEVDALKLFQAAVDRGINFSDNSWDYNQGELASKTVSALDCLHFALSLPTSVVITGIDSMAVLDQAIEAAKTFSNVSKEELAAILDRTKPLASGGAFEPFKTSATFDSTAAHPEWLGYNPQM